MDDHKLSERPYIDHKTGQRTTLFLYKNKPCQVVALSSPVARQFAGYSLIRVDLLDARAWLQRAYDLVPPGNMRRSSRAAPALDRYFLSGDPSTFQLIKSLWFSAIVVYGKCYASAEGRKVKLERGDLPKEYRETHDKVLALRNTIVAHAGVTARESATVKLVLSPSAKTDKLWLRADIAREDFADDRDDPVPFASLIEQVVDQVNRKVERLKKRLLEKEVFPFGKQHWYNKSTHRGS